MKVFILEDSYSRVSLFQEILSAKNELYIRDNVKDAKALFAEHYPFGLICLDHDLSDEHYKDFSTEVGTGTEFARWMADYSPNCPVIIHSYNPDGRLRMQVDLTRAGWNVKVQPFGMTLLRELEAL
jgi:DNA-binding NarL/FixJ family response regulator